MCSINGETAAVAHRNDLVGRGGGARAADGRPTGEREGLARTWGGLANTGQALNPGSGSPPVSGALEPVEDVGAAGVVDLVERVGVRLLDGHGVAAETDGGSTDGRSLGTTKTGTWLQSHSFDVESKVSDHQEE